MVPATLNYDFKLNTKKIIVEWTRLLPFKLAIYSYIIVYSIVGWNISNIGWLLDYKKNYGNTVNNLKLSHIIHLPFHFRFLVHLALLNIFVVDWPIDWVIQYRN